MLMRLEGENEKGTFFFIKDREQKTIWSFRLGQLKMGYQPKIIYKNVIFHNLRNKAIHIQTGCGIKPVDLPRNGYCRMWISPNYHP